MTPWPWTVSEFSSEIKGRGYPIKHGSEYVGWMVGHDDAQMAAKLPQIVRMAKRLLDTIDHLSPEQQALLQPHYIVALRETLRSMMSGEEKDNPAAPEMFELLYKTRNHIDKSCRECDSKTIVPEIDALLDKIEGGGDGK